MNYLLQGGRSRADPEVVSSPITEEELVRLKASGGQLNFADVSRLNKPTKSMTQRSHTIRECLGFFSSFLLSLIGYLCSIGENVFGIDFTRFKLRDLDSGTVLFEVVKPANGMLTLPPPTATRYQHESLITPAYH